MCLGQGHVISPPKELNDRFSHKLQSHSTMLIVWRASEDLDLAYVFNDNIQATRGDKAIWHAASQQLASSEFTVESNTRLNKPNV